MTPERMRQIEDIFHAACELPPAEREKYLSHACGSDHDLRREVELLLASDGEAGSLIDSPAYELAAPLIATDTSKITPGMNIGHYEILSRLGAGGMGEVWRARDKHLKRDVAIKVLPPEFAQDGDRLRRFEREARAASALNHPNIITIHEIGSFENTRFIVTELVEGHTLRHRMESGRVKLSEVLKIAVQTAGALAAAHDVGIIHRDIKPENIIIRSDGLVKVLDFGLAKLKPESILGDDDSEVQTGSTLTGPGVVMGTVGYMSPEQVRGKDVDHRTDIFSFGVLLYEMLCGQRPFQGESMAETMAAIANEEPPEPASINSNVPAPLERILKRCMEKQPERRFQSASDLGFALEALSAPGSAGANKTKAGQSPLLVGETSTLAQRRHWRERIAWTGLAVVSLIALVLSVKDFNRVSSDQLAIRFSIPPPEKVTGVNSPTISPDGRHLAFIATAEGKSQLWVRPLDSLVARPLQGTEGAENPFWSPDSQMIGFFAQGNLKKVALSGTPPTTLCDAPTARGGTWSRDGVILFTLAVVGVYRVSDEGGPVSAVTMDERLRFSFGLFGPNFLPDGKHFLHVEDDLGICLASLDGGESKQLIPDFSYAAYATSPDGAGYLLFVRDGAMLAQPFDAVEQRVTGSPVQLGDKIQGSHIDTTRVFSVSQNGVLAFSTRSNNGGRQLGWFDREGKPLGLIGSPGTQLITSLSPDENRIAVSRKDPQERFSDIWLRDLVRGTESRFTSDPGPDLSMIWSPDGSRIVWSAHHGGVAGLYQKAASGAGKDELLLNTDFWIFPQDWSRDGRYIIFGELNPKTSNDLWILPLYGDRKPYLYLQTPFIEREARFSPNSKWIAYISDRSGNHEVYVQAFPPDGIEFQVSTNGGLNPYWRRDGKEIFYLGNGKLMSVEVKTDAAFVAGTPKSLFDLRSIRADRRVDLSERRFSVTSDGQKFLFATEVEDISDEPFTVLLNWAALLPKSK